MGRGNEHRNRQRQFGAQPADPWGDYAPQPTYERTPRPQASRASSERQAEARVKWFNPDKGFGFVELTDGSGEAFLHIRQVEAAGHSTLPSGTTLVVQVGSGQKGPQVNEIVSADTSTAEPEPARRGPRAPGQSSNRLRQGGSPAAVPDTLGTVKWYDGAKGFGFIAVEGESKDLFVHVSVLERAGLGGLEPGQRVLVAIVEGRKGREVGAIELA
ncbi:cold-shock protein [Microvirga makkahensis]|uniref:Cold shock domain-containing protein n=1 Tax=Microvirga makkahensis TaxID=1128670 RepID=A0A7X3MU65_9HYPH|nr:cold-shock protein [Microvirga makkahensis]MXQ13108.1 cold shock domain-containing protein [Microvirga makkahensis]